MRSEAESIPAPSFPAMLEELRVLEFVPQTAALGTRLLSDMGAEVTIIVSPRSELPEEKATLGHLYENAGKKRITLDVEQYRDRVRFLNLVRQSHAIVESLAPGRMKALGLDYPSLARINPRIILVSLTPYGQQGPRSLETADDLAVAATGGQMHATGEAHTPPLKLAGHQSHNTAALYAAIAILLARRRALYCGKGSHIDIALQECTASALEHVLPALLHGGSLPARQGSSNPETGNCILPCRDGWIHANLHHRFHTLVDWMDADRMAGELTDTSWHNESYRRKHFDRLTEWVGRWTRTQAKTELMHTAQLMQYPWGVVQSPAEILKCPQLKARHFFSTVDKVPVFPGTPFTMDGRRPHPKTGGQCNHHATERRISSTPVQDGSDRSDPSALSFGTAASILEGLRILDFSRILAGPYATRLLADFGAEVIKVQSHHVATGAEQNQTPYFKTWNRNKRSITLDMNQSEAREAVLSLVACCDVVVENFAPRVMANWEMAYDRLKAANPRLIMVSMSAAGQSGPHREHVGYGQTVQSLGGLNWLTAFSADHPIGAGYAHADIISGLYADLAVLAALAARDRSGQGVYIDLSEYEAVCTLVGPALMAEGVGSERWSPCGNADDRHQAAPQGCYPCKGDDRWCTLSIYNNQQWQGLCKLLNSAAWPHDSSMASIEGRIHHQEKINAAVAAWTIHLTPREAVHHLQQAGIPSGIVNHPSDLPGDLQLAARGFFRPLDPNAPDGSLMDANPIRFDDNAPCPCRPAPGLGDDNQYVFGELLGWSAEKLAAMIRRKVVY